jgi:hypothetical protein
MSANGSDNTPRTVMVPTARAGETARHEFAGSQLARTGETASTAMAAQMTAAVQARHIMAMKNPRDLLVARARLLKDCARPAFADVAIYRKPVGDGIEGPSIRLAEAAARAMTNIYSSVTAIYDDAQKRIVRVSATDLESNLTYDKDVTVPKTMERSKLKPGQTPIKHRMNSKGNPVFLVEAETDDDILNAENALASKALRVCLLRLIPGDILDEAMREAYSTIEKKIKDDPDQALKAMCDGFEMELGISPEQLKDYMGHPLAQTTVAEIAMMRKLFAAIRDNETTWAEAMDNRSAPVDTAKPAEAPAAKGKANVNDLAAAAKAKREAEAKQKAKPDDGPKLDRAPQPEPEDVGDVPEWMKSGDPEPRD